jgi:hypothetical protein
VRQEYLCHPIGPNRKYHIIRAKRLTNRFGPTAVLTIRDAMEAPPQVFLPRRYSDVVTDTDIEQINSNAVFLHLVYRGACSTTKAYLLAIEMQCICFHFITGTPCRHETPRQGVRWINRSVRNTTRLMQLYRIDYLNISHPN